MTMLLEDLEDISFTDGWQLFFLGLCPSRMVTDFAGRAMITTWIYNRISWDLTTAMGLNGI